MLCSMEIKLLFHFRGCLGNLISGIRTIQRPGDSLFLDYKRFHLNFQKKRKLSTWRVHECQSQVLHQFHSKTLFHLSLRNSGLFQVSASVGALFFRRVPVHQLVIENICCHSKWWRNKLNKDNGPFRRLGVNGLSILLRQSHTYG